MASPEHGPMNVERGEQLIPKDFERAPEILDKAAEKAPESKEEVERNTERARAEADKEAISGREVSRGEHKQRGDESSHTKSLPHSRDAGFKQTMKHVQAELSGPERTFSKVIHNKTVERVSDAVGGTIARPDAILSGSIFAFIAVLSLYLMAKYYGFALSGFETIAAFVIGWLFGIVFDFVKAAITGKRR